jgi:hypothetical protein
MTCFRHRLTETGAVFVATVMLSALAWAAPMREHVRGTVLAISGDTLTVRTVSGAEVPVTLTASTHYSEVLKSSLDRVDAGSYIGTATKSTGNELVALEVVVFPPSMRGVGEGHYSWDPIPDTTLGDRTTAASTMTNGTVRTATPAAATVSSTMTNGTVASTNTANGAKEITVTYKGGKQVIIVPPTAPIVTLRPAKMAGVKAGSPVFITVLNDDGKETAVAVAVGSDSVKPPM